MRSGLHLMIAFPRFYLHPRLSSTEQFQPRRAGVLIIDKGCQAMSGHCESQHCQLKPSCP
jgi:hypothetical protein